MTPPDIGPVANRRFQKIPVDRIQVINSRLRDEEQLQMNVQSIDHTGLMIPIRVNDKYYSKTGMYELICGEGRLIAHQRLGRTEISAEIVTCTRRRALLESLIENIARTKPCTMDFARELKRMKDNGVDFSQIARICCRSEEYVRQYIRLVEKGEERLIRGVERGIVPISFAVLVASTDDGNIQGVLLDAFDKGIVTSANFAQVRRIINCRMDRRHGKNGRDRSKPLTVLTLRSDITEMTRTKDSFVREAKAKENRFHTLLLGVNSLWRDAELKAILQTEKLMNRPELTGEYSYES